MEQKNKQRKENGITLIALVITIIVMLILVGVTINLAVNGNLFNYARDAAAETKNAILAEQELANEVLGQYLNGGEETATTSTETSYVGCYADINNNGELDIEDGIIYVDLAIGASGEWVNSDGAFNFSVVDNKNLKSYTEVSSSVHLDGCKFADAKLISLATSQRGTERFYVMKLQDESGKYTWEQAMALEGDTWKIPTKEQWSAFACADLTSSGPSPYTSITNNNCDSYGFGLHTGYWSSSTYSSTASWLHQFSLGWCAITKLQQNAVRLCTIF